MFDEALEIVQTRLEGLHDVVIVAMCVALAVFGGLCGLLILRGAAFRSRPGKTRRKRQESHEKKQETDRQH